MKFVISLVATLVSTSVMVSGMYLLDRALRIFAIH
jgi:hypothetical protein